MLLAEPISNIANTARAYSQICGVLAGFAFSALLYYLRGETGNQKDDTLDPSRVTMKSVTPVLLSTLTSLIICAIIYGVLAGANMNSSADNPTPPGNAYSALMINGPAFATSILAMFYAIGLAARPHPDLSSMLLGIRLAIGLVSAPLAMLMVAAAGYDIDKHNCDWNASTIPASHCTQEYLMASSRPLGLGICLTLLLLALALPPITFDLLSMMSRRFQSSLVGMSRLGRWSLPRDVAATSSSIVALLVSSVAAAAGVGTVLLDLQPANYLLPDATINAILTACFVALAAISVLVSLSCRPLPASGSDESGAQPAIRTHLRKHVK